MEQLGLGSGFGGTGGTSIQVETFVWNDLSVERSIVAVDVFYVRSQMSPVSLGAST